MRTRALNWSLYSRVTIWIQRCRCVSSVKRALLGRGLLRACYSKVSLSSGLLSFLLSASWLQEVSRIYHKLLLTRYSSLKINLIFFNLEKFIYLHYHPAPSYFFIFIFRECVCVCICVFMCAKNLQGPKEGVRSLGAGVTGSCKSLSVGFKNWTEALCNNRNPRPSVRTGTRGPL